MSRRANAVAPDHEALPRVLDLAALVAARRSEMRELAGAVDASTSTRRVFQTLPRHLRRRTMSHNVHRLPAHLRAQAVAEKAVMERTGEAAAAAASAPPASRRKKRRPRYALHEAQRRAAGRGWLETHIWHAKRMHMRALWGHAVAMSPTDKSLRWSYKAAARQCVAHDASYTRTVAVEGERAALAAAFAGIAAAHSPPLLGDATADGARRGRLHLARPPCPAEFLWVGARELRLWLHPASADAVCAALAAAPGVSVSDAPLLRFELTGPRSTRTLRAVLGRQPGGAGAGLWRAVPAASALPDGAVVALRVPDFRSRGSMPRQPGAVAPPQPAMPHDALMRWPAAAGVSDLWHARGGEPGEREEAGADGPAADVPVVLVARAAGGRELGCGWDVLLPPGQGVAAWTALVFAGARAVGLGDMRRLASERGVPFYPHDYPDSEAGAALAAAESADLERQWHRRPPAKRVNYARLAVPHPFAPHWAGEAPPAVVRDPAVLRALVSGGALPASTPRGALVRVAVVARGRGAFEFNAAICRAGEGDAGDETEVEQPRGATEPARASFGHVTVAHFSMLRGRSQAAGFADARAVADELGKSAGKGGAGPLVLVRNPGSRLYRKCSLRVLFS